MPGTVYSFGPFELDQAARRLTRGGALVPVANRHLSVLLDLLAHAGSVRTKDALAKYDEAARLGLDDPDFVKVHQRAKERVTRIEDMLTQVRKMEHGVE